MLEKRETIHHMGRRCRDWDYRCRAIYHITLVQEERGRPLLGELDDSVIKLVKAPEGLDREIWLKLVGRPCRTRHGAELASGDAARAPRVPGMRGILLTEIGDVVVACWRELARQWPGIKILDEQVMPDHFHGVIFIETPQKKTLGNIIGSFKSRTTSLIRSRLGDSALNFWTDGFVDTIVFREGQLQGEIDYLRDNPRRLAVKRAFPDLFKVVGAFRMAMKNQGDGRFMAIGNRFLLDRQLLQVQVSRRDFTYRRVDKPGGGLKIERDADGSPCVDVETSAFVENRDDLLAAARHGSVLISPCISDGERAIARCALMAGLPLVTLQNKGFSRLQKPSGRHFDACCAGNLLMLAPAAWPYVPGEKPMTRFDATAMNRLAQWIAGNGAAEINYHGLAPDNIDALARAAAEMS